MLLDPKTFGITRDLRPTVASIVPMGNTRPKRELLPQVLPDEAVTSDSVAQYRDDLRRPSPTSCEELGPVVSGNNDVARISLQRRRRRQRH